LAILPKETKAAFEFRHESWFDEEVFKRLRDHGAALCVAESDDLKTPLVATASWGYLRLRGTNYDSAALKEWAQRILAQPWQDAYIFFKHEDAGKGPAYAKELEPLLKK